MLQKLLQARTRVVQLSCVLKPAVLEGSGLRSWDAAVTLEQEILLLTSVPKVWGPFSFRDQATGQPGEAQDRSQDGCLEFMGIRGFPCLFFFTSDDVNGSSVFSEQMGGKCWDLGFPSAVATVNIWIGVHLWPISAVVCVSAPKPEGSSGDLEGRGTWCACDGSEPQWSRWQILACLCHRLSLQCTCGFLYFLPSL